MMNGIYLSDGKGEDKYDNVRIGMNSRLDTIQAAILDVKLKYLDEEIESCNRIAEEYNKKLSGYVKVPVPSEGYYSAWAQYTILLKNGEERDKVIDALKREGIPSNIYYKKPMHMQKAFNYRFENIIKNSSDICTRCLSLPMHPFIEDKEINIIVDIIKNVVNK